MVDGFGSDYYYLVYQISVVFIIMVFRKMEGVVIF